MTNKQILSKLAGISLATSIAFLGTANTAQALDFSFSFDDTVDPNQGTVTGTIMGLNDNANGQQPASVTVDNAPASLGFTSLPLSLDYTDGNGFDVSNGAIVNASALYTGVDAGLRFNTDPNGANRLRNIGNSEFSRAVNGFSGVTYTASSNPPTSVPFGVSTNMGIVILGGMYGASRLRKKLAANK